MESEVPIGVEACLYGVDTFDPTCKNPLFLLTFVRPEQIDRMRDAESTASEETSGSSSAADIETPES